MNQAAQAVGFLIAAFIAFFLFNIALMSWQLTPISAASMYENVRNLRWHRDDLAEHFPETIPASARNPGFYYRAGFLQGGASIELRIEMPAKFVEDVYATHLPLAKSVFNGNQQLLRGTDEPIDLLKGYFYTFPRTHDESPSSRPLLPDDFETLLLSSHPHRSGPADWNRGESRGISISRERREIIYWAEDW